MNNKKIMSLEKYKNKVFEYLINVNKVSTTEAKVLMTATETYRQELLEDKLTPQETAYGMLIHLL